MTSCSCYSTTQQNWVCKHEHIKEYSLDLHQNKCSGISYQRYGNNPRTRYCILENKVMQNLYVYEYRCIAIVGAIGRCTLSLLIFNLLAHFPNSNSAPQRCIADKSRGKSSLSSNWAGTKSIEFTSVPSRKCNFWNILILALNSEKLLGNSFY